MFLAFLARIVVLKLNLTAATQICRDKLEEDSELVLHCLCFLLRESSTSLGFKGPAFVFKYTALTQEAMASKEGQKEPKTFKIRLA